MANRLGLIVLSLSIAGCHGATRTTPTGASLDDVPEGVFSAPAEALAAVITHHDVPYLFVSHAYGFDAVLAAGVELPECVTLGQPSERCPHTFDAPASLATGAAPPATVSLLTASGPCEARVAGLYVLDTHGCELSTTIAYRLEGCAAPVAGVARLAGSFDPNLRYVPAPAAVDVRVERTQDADAPSDALLDALSDARLRTRVGAWLAAPEITRAPLQGGVVSQVLLDAGAEVLEASALGALVGVFHTCDQSLEHRFEAGIRRDGGYVRLTLDEDFVGAVTWRGRVVGVLTGAPWRAAASTVARDGTVTELFSTHVWSDNEECGPHRIGAIDHPCGP